MKDREKGIARHNRTLGVPRWFDDARKRDLTAGRALSREERRENRENSSGKRITRRRRSPSEMSACRTNTSLSRRENRDGTRKRFVGVSGCRSNSNYSKLALGTEIDGSILSNPEDWAYSRVSMSLLRNSVIRISIRVVTSFISSGIAFSSTRYSVTLIDGIL